MRTSIFTSLIACAAADFFVCDDGGLGYSVGDQISLSVTCSQLWGSSYSYKFSNSAFVVYSTSNACTFDDAPLKSTKVLNSCTAVLPNSTFSIVKFDSECYPTSCTPSACWQYSKQADCATHTQCGWSDGLCVSQCYTHSFSDCPSDTCTTNAAYCFGKALDDSATSLRNFSIAVIVVLVLGCLSSCALVVALVFGCSRRNTTTVQYVASPQGAQYNAPAGGQYGDPSYGAVKAL